MTDTKFDQIENLKGEITKDLLPDSMNENVKI